MEIWISGVTSALNWTLNFVTHSLDWKNALLRPRVQVSSINYCMGAFSTWMAYAMVASSALSTQASRVRRFAPWWRPSRSTFIKGLLDAE
jgi:hypothetical protein